MVGIPSSDVLVAAAFRPELEFLLRTECGENAMGRLGHLSFCAREVGVGLPLAAIGASRHIGELRPRAVVLIGTCGEYDGSGLAKGDVIVSRRIHLADLAALEGRAQFPPPMATVLEADGRLLVGLSTADARVADVATTLAITVEDAAAATVARRTGAGVEHLESYGVAVACSALGIPFIAVLGVANTVGSQGRAQWRANHESASVAAGEHLLGWLRQGAPGLPL